MRRKFWKSASGIAVLMSILAGCGNMSGADETKNTYESLTRVKEPEKIGYEDWEKKIELREENPVSGEFIRAVNEFSYRSAAELLGGNQNVGNRNYSPLSLYYALALTAQGAGGETEAEFLELLGMEDKETLASECGRLFRRLYEDNEISRTKLADSLWMRQGQTFNKAFLETAGEDFYASLFPVDFGTEETGKAMGQWIADQTGGLIAPEIQTSAEDVLAIINTVWLYDEWGRCFQEELNTEAPFTRASGEEIICEYMNQELDSQIYYKGENYAGTSLGLKNAGSMFLILPDEGVDVRELLTEEKLKEMFTGQEGAFGKVKLSLPKFRFGDSADMMPLLRKMGLLSAFDNTAADFSEMTDEQIFISLVKQETFVGINENGVEAAAYTLVEATGGCAPAESEICELNFDRPFLFGIISDTGVPLFLGICEDPLQG